MTRFITKKNRRFALRSNNRVFSKKQIAFLQSEQSRIGIPDRLSAKEIGDLNQKQRQILLKHEKVLFDVPKRVVISFNKSGKPVFAK